ncbi:hypothetical protein BH09MYX1_BH09MYX1_36680 [soil metagenome]
MIDASSPPAKISTTLALWRLSRPTFSFWLLGIPLIGYGFAHWDRAIAARNTRAIPWLLAAWYLLSAATLWLNASLDEDECGALFAAQTVRPKHVDRWGYAGLGFSVALAAMAGRGVLITCAVCAIMSVLYSHPKTMWKGHPILGPMVNVVGYGVLSMLSGWWLADVTMNLRTVLSFVLLAWWILGIYFAAQAFQYEDDSRRGYRTMVVTHGPEGALRAGRICMATATTAFFVLAAMGFFPRTCLLTLPFFLYADRRLRRWQKERRGGTASSANAYVKRVLFAAIATLAFAYVDYFRADARGEPVCGLGTVAGKPD